MLRYALFGRNPQHSEIPQLCSAGISYTVWMKLSSIKASLAAFFGITLMPLVAYAHEVYVLDERSIARDIAAISPNPFTAYYGNEFLFYFYGFISVVVTLTIAFASLFHLFEARLDPFLFRLKKYAHVIERLTLGFCFVAFAYYAALYGPELPFSDIFGSATPIFQIIFAIMGIMMLVGYRVRLVASMTLAFVTFAFAEDGWYVFSYLNYIGSLVFLIILGAGQWSLDSYRNDSKLEKRIKNTLRAYEHLAFPILRISLGLSIMIAAVYAKYVHSALALDVVTRFHLTTYFPSDPLFVVMGALIIEFLAGLFLVIGFEIRWTLLFLAFWLTLSLLYFTEAVWPHVVLFGLAVSLFCHGYDRYTLEGYFLKKHRREPFL